MLISTLASQEYSNASDMESCRFAQDCVRMGSVAFTQCPGSLRLISNCLLLLLGDSFLHKPCRMMDSNHTSVWTSTVTSYRCVWVYRKSWMRNAAETAPYSPQSTQSLLLKAGHSKEEKTIQERKGGGREGNERKRGGDGMRPQGWMWLAQS